MPGQTDIGDGHGSQILFESGSSYLVVLNPDQTVAGIVTKTSMASAMAEQLWG